MRIRKPKEMTSKLGEWLSKRLEEEGWSHRELARRMGVSQTAVSAAIAGGGVRPDFCKRLARVMNEPLQNIYRLAGILPPLQPGVRGKIQQVVEYTELLEDHDIIIEFLKWRLWKEKGDIDQE